MVFKRSYSRTVLIVLYASAMAVASYNFFGEWANNRGTWVLVLANILGVWSAVMVYSLITFNTYGELRADGLLLNRPLGAHSFTWDQMTWAYLPQDKRIGMIGYIPKGADRERRAPVSYRVLGSEAVDAIRNAVVTARPNLPQIAPTKIHEGAAT